jgi:hypothetical protein
MTADIAPNPIAQDRPGRGGGDAGLTLVLMALLMTAMLTVVALVIDLGYVRGVARSDQSIADLAALAGSEQLERSEYVAACRDMIDYVNHNANGMPAIDANGFCTPMGTTVCTGGTVAQAAPSTTSGKYTITIEFPVPDEAGAYPALGAGSQDGIPCDRMRVTVRSTDQPFFGGVAGAESYEVTRSATVRAGPGNVRKAPALWLLEPYYCNALRTSGSQTSIIVGDMGASPPIEGLITVDSDGSRCSGQAVTINASQGKIHALPIPSQMAEGQEPGEIRLFAMDRWATSCSPPACDSAHDVKPTPIHVPERATRAPVDHWWNCKTSYPAYDPYPTQPKSTHPPLEMPDCPNTATDPPYIDWLKAWVGGAAGTTPSGFTRYTGSCSISGIVVIPVGNWYFPCALSVGNNSSLTFQGGNIVVDGGITVQSSSSVLRINHDNPLNVLGLPASCMPTPSESLCTHSSPKAAFVYVRNGDLDVKHRFEAKHTMVHLANGTIKVTGGGGLNWTAPTEGPFRGLAAWSERPGAYSLAGGANVTMAGAFFTPFADPMSISGGGGWDVREAQYISQRIEFSGNSTLTMAPNPVEAVPVFPKKGFLIR